MTAALTEAVPVLGSAAIPIVASFVIAAAVFALAMTLLSMNDDNRSDLEKRLTGFAGSETDAEMERDAENDVDNGLMQDMVSFTGRMADRIGLLNRVENKLEQADLPLRPPEALFVYLAIVVVVFIASILMC